MCMMPIIGQRDGRAGVELVGYQDTLGGRQVTIKGAARCGDKSCVICSTKISEGLAAEIEGVARRWLAAGGTVLHWSLALGWRPDEDPVDRRKAHVAAIRSAFQGRKVTQLAQAAGGNVYRCTGTECTTEVLVDGTALLHAHLHGVMFVAVEDSKRAHDAVYRHLVEHVLIPEHQAGRPINWQHALSVETIERDSDDVLAQVTRLSGYLSKGSGWGLGNELTGAQRKRGSGAKLTVPQLLTVFAETGDIAYRDAYRGYLAVMAGQSPIRLAREMVGIVAYAERCGLDALNDTTTQREAALLAEYLDDEQEVTVPDDTEARAEADKFKALANEERHGGEPLVFIDAPTWNDIQRLGILAAVIDATRQAPPGRAAEYVAAVLARAGVPPVLLDGIHDLEPQDPAVTSITTPHS